MVGYAVSLFFSGQTVNGVAVGEKRDDSKQFEYDHSYWSVDAQDPHFTTQEQVMRAVYVCVHVLCMCVHVLRMYVCACAAYVCVCMCCVCMCVHARIIIACCVHNDMRVHSHDVRIMCV